jgi:hypothetical protein
LRPIHGIGESKLNLCLGRGDPLKGDRDKSTWNIRLACCGSSKLRPDSEGIATTQLQQWRGGCGVVGTDDPIQRGLRRRSRVHRDVRGVHIVRKNDPGERGLRRIARRRVVRVRSAVGRRDPLKGDCDPRPAAKEGRLGYVGRRDPLKGDCDGCCCKWPISPCTLGRRDPRKGDCDMICSSITSQNSERFEPMTRTKGDCDLMV